MSHERFGEIRSMLHSQAPSEELWRTLTGLLWGWRAHLPQEAIAAYCDDLLESWPDELRVLPKSWLRAVLRGEAEPIFTLCRAVLVANRHIDLPKLSTLLSCETLNRVTILDLSNNSFDTEASTTSWVDMLANAPMAVKIKRLVLRRCHITPETFVGLEKIDLRGLQELELSWSYQVAQLPHWLDTPLAPRQLKFLGLQYVVDEDMQEGHTWSEAQSFNKNRLRTSGLNRLLHTIQVEHLDIIHCHINPLTLAKHDALKQLGALSCSIDYNHDAWLTFFSGADLSSLEVLRIASFNGRSHVDLLEVLRIRMALGDMPLRVLELPQSVCVWQIFHTDYKELFEARLDVVRVFDE